jgi:cell division protein FtsI/penicillin-binding protein 2
MKLENGNDEYQPPKSGLFLLQICIVILFSLFCARFWYLQIHRGAEYVRMAQENRLRHERIYAPRGEIYDASGRLLWKHTETGVPTDQTYAVDWNLTTSGGRRLQTGVYLYRVAISSDGSSQASRAKKLIILSNK